MKAFLAAALLASSCSAGVAPRAVDPARDRPLLRPPLTAPDPRGLRGLHPTSWHDAVYVDYRTVDLHFTAGIASCGRLADVRVSETPTSVTVTLVYGGIALPEGHVCQAIGFNARTRVRLPGPLEGRRLVDGESGETRRLRPY